MLTITVPDKYAEALSALGEIQPAIDQVVQRYAIEQIADKIVQLRRAEVIQAKYGINYVAFTERVAKDESFVQMLETQLDPLWEMDLAEWAFCAKGLKIERVPFRPFC